MELMIVISIMAILAAIAVPQYNIFTYNNALKSAARELAGDIQLIRQKAMAGSPSATVPLPYTLLFLDNTSYKYTIPSDIAPYNALTITKKVTDFHPDISIKFADITFPGNQVIFQGRGTIAPWGKVTLTNFRQSTVTLTASPPAGRINVQYTMQ